MGGSSKTASRSVVAARSASTGSPFGRSAGAPRTPERAATLASVREARARLRREYAERTGGRGRAAHTTNQEVRRLTAESHPLVAHPRFAQVALGAARAALAKGGGFGGSKAFISKAYVEFRKNPEFRSVSLGSFKRSVVAASRAGSLSLSRADLVEAMRKIDVRRSTAHYMGATFNFIRID